MAIKKTTTGKITKKKTTPKRKVMAVDTKENVVEQKLNSMVDETPSEISTKAKTMGRPPAQKSSPTAWGIFTLLLLLILATILLYNYNKDFW